MKNRIIFSMLLGLFIILNLAPTYLGLWNMPLIPLERPEFSFIEADTRNILDSVIHYLIIIGLWTPISIGIIKYKWQFKILIVPTLISLTLFLAMIYPKNIYPNESSEYTENGYKYRIEIWKNKNETKIKHWKSQDSLINYKTNKNIKWELIKNEINN